MPSQLEEWEATDPIETLAWFIDTFSGLPSVLEDQRQWQHFAETIRHQIISYPLRQTQRTFSSGKDFLYDTASSS